MSFSKRVKKMDTATVIDTKNWEPVSKAGLTIALSREPETFHGDSFFDLAAEAEMKILVPKPHPADVRLAIMYTSSFARRGERQAGNPLPERGFVPHNYMDIYRYSLCKLNRARQVRDMQAAMHTPVVESN